MLRSLRYINNSTSSFKKCTSKVFYSTSIDPYTDKVNKARFDCIDQLQKADPSSLFISKLYPEYLRDAFIAFKSFNLELSKISFGFQPGATAKSKEFNNLKFHFWLQQLDKCNNLSLSNASQIILDINEPCTILLSDIILKDLKFNIEMLKQMVHSHQHFYNNNSSNGFNNLDEICSFGEGTQSQINYLLQSILLSPQLKGFSDIGIELLELPHSNSNNLRNNLTDISAHLGQATSIGSFLIGLKYFAERKQSLMLPIDCLTKYRLSEENCLRYLQGGYQDTSDIEEIKEKINNVVFDVATLANDHIISARSKLESAKSDIIQIANDNNRKDLLNCKKSFPECFFLPYMSGIPTIMYLERLEKHNFDVLHPGLQQKEWRLAFRTWNADRTRSF